MCYLLELCMNLDKLPQPLEYVLLIDWFFACRFAAVERLAFHRKEVVKQFQSLPSQWNNNSLSDSTMSPGDDPCRESIVCNSSSGGRLFKSMQPPPSKLSRPGADSLNRCRFFEVCLDCAALPEALLKHRLLDFCMGYTISRGLPEASKQA